MRFLNGETCPTCCRNPARFIIIVKDGEPRPACIACKNQAERHGALVRAIEIEAAEPEPETAAEPEPQRLDLFAETAPRRGLAATKAPSTSHAQAERVRPRTGTQRAAILALLHREAPHGLTDQEMAEWLGMFLSSTQARRVELRDGAWIEDSSRRRPTEGGNPSVVWVLTGAGRAELDRNPLAAPARPRSA